MCLVIVVWVDLFFFFSSRRRHTRSYGDWSSDVCSSDLWPFAMLTTRGALPVAPLESRTLAITVFGPSLNCFVFHPIEIGPDEVSVVGGATVAPSMVSV